MTKNLFQRAKRRIKYFFDPKAIVLSYHRIADLNIDPWQLAVSPSNFEQHLKVLKKFNVISTNQLIKCLRSGSLKKGMVCITFDDGYRDNYFAAKPLLQKYQSLSTIFIPTNYIGAKEQFWWDELQAILLGKHGLPPKLSILINKILFSFDLENECEYDETQWQKLTSWVWYDPPPNKRGKLYMEIWMRLKPLDYCEIISVLSELKQWASVRIQIDEAALPMTSSQLQQLMEDPLFEIELHTMTHPALALHNRQKQIAEIAGCIRRLQEIGNTSAQTIAYPYGSFNEETISITEQLGLKGGFTTENKPVKKDDDFFKLGRVHVKNWDGKTFEKQLKYWINGINL